MTGLINGTTPTPPEFIASEIDAAQQVSNLAYVTWFQIDQLLLSWLLSSLTEEVYPYIIGLQSSQVVW